MQSIAIRFQNIYRQKSVQIMLKMALFALLLLLLYTQLQDAVARISVEKMMLFWGSMTAFDFFLIALSVLLMPLNWILETLKWQSLMKAEDKINFTKAFKAVLAGLTVSLFTPNRVGEYGGRVLFVEPEKRMNAVFATLMGSMAQWLALLSGGMMALGYLLYQQLMPQPYFNYSLSLLFPGMILLLLLIFFYYKFNFFIDKAIKWKLKPLWAKKIQHLIQKGKVSALNSALIFAFIRYAVYALQYLVILQALGFDAGLFNGLAALCFVFLLQTGLPVPPSMGLLARGSIAVTVFGIIFVNNPEIQFTVLGATFMLWFINLLIPALFGAAFIAAKRIRLSAAD